MSDKILDVAWHLVPVTTITIFVLMIWVAASTTPATWETSAKCMAHGYPNYATYWYITHMDRYCIKRVNNSDIVVPLSEAEGK